MSKVKNKQVIRERKNHRKKNEVKCDICNKWVKADTTIRFEGQLICDSHPTPSPANN